MIFGVMVIWYLMIKEVLDAEFSKKRYQRGCFGYYVEVAPSPNGFSFLFLSTLLGAY
jgi:hypothetical protein